MERLTYQQIADRYIIRKLKSSDVISSFDCGDEDLNDYILNEAKYYSEALLSTTYLMIDKITNEIVAFYSLAADSISLNSFADKAEFNRFRKKKFVNDKRIKSYPAIKLCRLGTCNSVRGAGLGSFLLNTIKYIVLHEQTYGCRFITVDAYLDAVSFYQKYDFDYLSSEEKETKRPLLFFDVHDLLD